MNLTVRLGTQLSEGSPCLPRQLGVGQHGRFTDGTLIKTVYLTSLSGSFCHLVGHLYPNGILLDHGRSPRSACRRRNRRRGTGRGRPPQRPGLIEIRLLLSKNWQTVCCLVTCAGCWHSTLGHQTVCDMERMAECRRCASYRANSASPVRRRTSKGSSFWGTSHKWCQEILRDSFPILGLGTNF